MQVTPIVSYREAPFYPPERRSCGTFNVSRRLSGPRSSQVTPETNVNNPRKRRCTLPAVEPRVCDIIVDSLSRARAKNDWISKEMWFKLTDYSQNCLKSYIDSMQEDDAELCVEYAKECMYTIVTIMLTYFGAVTVPLEEDNLSILCNVIVHLSVKYWCPRHYDQTSFAKYLTFDGERNTTKRELMNLETHICEALCWSIPRPRCETFGRIW